MRQTHLPRMQETNALGGGGMHSRMVCWGAALVAPGLCHQQFWAWRTLHSKCPLSSSCSGQLAAVPQCWTCEKDAEESMGKLRLVGPLLPSCLVPSKGSSQSLHCAKSKSHLAMTETKHVPKKRLYGFK